MRRERDRWLVLTSLLVLASAGCKRGGGYVGDPEDDPRRIVVDTETVCTEISGGDLRRWPRAALISPTWQRIATRALDGEARASCDAARMIEKQWRETKTCTPRLAAVMRESCPKR
ncbi:MAG: hypothetical protein IPK80_22530 [Nannocystis sp.]|nr:hypothetical protein [Nannocystis sp.]